jgi:hypothetical protein
VRNLHELANIPIGVNATTASTASESRWQPSQCAQEWHHISLALTRLVDETAFMVFVRQAKTGDGPQLWALNELPNIGATPDPDLPLHLPAVGPPTNFPDLTDVMTSFVGCGGDFVVAETDGQLVGMGGIKPTGAGRAEV